MIGSTNAVVIIGGEATGLPLDIEFTNADVNSDVQIGSFTCEEVVE